MAFVQAEDLFPDARNPEHTRVINARCLLKTQAGHRLVLVSGMVLAQYALADRMAEAHAIVGLVAQGWADQLEVARAFDCSARTVRRYQRRFEAGGLAALSRVDGYPRGRPRLAVSRRSWVQQLKAQGHSQREIARRIGVTENAVRKLLRRLGWKAPSPIQAELPFADKESAHPNLSAFCTEERSVLSLDADPADRRSDRLLARLGLLEDAPPLFGSATDSARAGVLLALPVLVGSGVFGVRKKSTAALARPSMGCAPAC